MIRFGCTGLCHCVIQIVNQLVHIFDTDREPDKTIGNAGLLTNLFWHAGVGHGCRVLNQGFYATEADGKLGNFDGVHHSFTRFQAAFDSESEQCAEAIFTKVLLELYRLLPEIRLRLKRSNQNRQSI